ncbi:hypothetical protein Hokovirus_3_31 [Hokovirus HKV1]|uniref:Uncharacterized protein n=1 Tax=Hokovirus HKV1 TaxID=1977638 RepID=A0A1V0SGK6_9VIRU|nr:hypothetical protein Hokovirus_3_31 [Hokovirus HKV1]
MQSSKYLLLLFGIFCIYHNYYIGEKVLTINRYSLISNHKNYTQHIIPKVYDFYDDSYNCSKKNINGSCPLNFKCTKYEIDGLKYKYTRYACIDPNLEQNLYSECHYMFIEHEKNSGFFCLELIIMYTIFVKLIIVILFLICYCIGFIFKKVFCNYYSNLRKKIKTHELIILQIDYRLVFYTPITSLTIFNMLRGFTCLFNRHLINSCFSLDNVEILPWQDIIVHYILEIITLVVVIITIKNMAIKYEKIYKKIM